MSEREFPILTKPKEYIPWDAIAPHEAQALRNHHQTLERLAERGGLSWVETYAVLTDNHFMSVMSLTEEACRKVHEDVDDYPLPYQSEYVDASFDISGDIEEAADMSKIYTSDYNSGKWGQDLKW